jgi:putative transposase
VSAVDDNPVKHGYVASAVDWPYSSVHRKIVCGNVAGSWRYFDEVSGNNS